MTPWPPPGHEDALLLRIDGGDVHLFSAAVDAQGRTGRRAPLATLEPGDVIPRRVDAGEGRVLLARLAPGAGVSTVGEPDDTAAARRTVARLLAREIDDDEPITGLADRLSDHHRAAVLTAEERARRRIERFDHDEVRAERMAFAALLPGLADADDADTVGGAGELTALATGLAATLGRPVEVPDDLGVDLDVEPVRAVRALLQANHLRHRRITLEQGWWRGLVRPVCAFDDAGRVRLVVPGPAGGIVLHPDGRREAAGAALVAGWIPGALEIVAGLGAGDGGLRSFARVAPHAARAPAGRFVVGAVLIGVVGVLVPMGTGVAFNEIIPAADRGRLVALIVTLVLAVVASVLLQVAQSEDQSRVDTLVGSAAHLAVLDRMLASPVGAFRSTGVGELIARAGAVDAARAKLRTSVAALVSSSVSMAIAVALMLWHDATLTLLGLAFALAVLSLGSWFQVRVARSSDAVAERAAATQSVSLQLMGGIAVLRTSGAEARGLRHWATAFVDQMDATERAARWTQRNQLLGTMAPPMATAVLVAVIVLRGGDAVDVGAFIAFNAVFGQFAASAAAIAQATGGLAGTTTSIRRIRTVLATEPEMGPDRRDPGRLEGRVRLAGVGFTYDASLPPVLQGVDLDVPAGSFCALVGASGSGKSTVLRLLLGFERPTSGSVLYDEKDLAALDLAAVRRQLGVVLQASRLTPGTIQANLLGDSGLGADEAWRIARTVALAEDIESMPMKLGTIVGEGGGTLSGGQRQRLLIGRALANRPKVLLLDEATSALDNVTQAVVSDRIAELGITRIVVAHRLSTVERADRIVVLEQGRVVEQGTYAELLAADGAFAGLVARQEL